MRGSEIDESDISRRSNLEADTLGHRGPWQGKHLHLPVSENKVIMINGKKEISINTEKDHFTSQLSQCHQRTQFRKVKPGSSLRFYSSVIRRPKHHSTRATRHAIEARKADRYLTHNLPPNFSLSRLMYQCLVALWCPPPHVCFDHTQVAWSYSNVNEHPLVAGERGTSGSNTECATSIIKESAASFPGTVSVGA